MQSRYSTCEYLPACNEAKNLHRTTSANEGRASSAHSAGEVRRKLSSSSSPVIFMPIARPPIKKPPKGGFSIATKLLKLFPGKRLRRAHRLPRAMLLPVGHFLLLFARIEPKYAILCGFLLRRIDHRTRQQHQHRQQRTQQQRQQKPMHTPRVRAAFPHSPPQTTPPARQTQ